METRANHMIVGVFVIAFMLGAMGFVIWLAKFQSDQVFTRYNIIYQGDVTGLKSGSAVRFRGVSVGEVVDVELSPDKPAEEIVILIEVDHTTPVMTDTVAILQLEGITGVRSVLLNMGTNEAGPLTEKGPYGYPVIRSGSSALDKLIKGAPELLGNTNVLVSRGNDLLNDQNRQNIADTLVHIRSLTQALAERENQIATMIDDTSTTAKNLKEMSASVKDLTADLQSGSKDLITRANHAVSALDKAATTINSVVGDSSPEIRSLVKDLQSTAQSFAKTSDQVEALIRENREPIQDFTSSGLYEFSNLLSESRKLVEDLQHLTAEIERDPARFFFGDKQKGYETSQ
ncbi:MlaD family protein [Kiloniella laminariae]|uniref:MlaD family protein n=1 Tax=Kiloniella laminariae TaxID=454162 RepID=A0ABT4LGT3_9PROT|nr:MlaD family protein [Kiloniella laminariae]MCZ4279207.1 MlaD family protein [Kiloniella laminariae]